MRKTIHRLTYLFFYLVGLVVFLHPVIFSHFSTLLGDEFDTRLILGIQEHWYRFFTGNASWLDLGMFYPLKNSLGFSDSFFLFGLSHSIFRFLGFDLYTSMIANYIFLSLVGYSGMVHLCRQQFNFSRLPSYIAGTLLISASPILVAVHAAHSQMLNVWLMPWFYYILGQSMKHQSHTGWINAKAAATGAFLALITYNGFYIGWFAVFHATIVIGLLALTTLARQINLQHNSPLKTIYYFPKYIWGVISVHRSTVLSFGIAFVVGLIPFLVTYLPVLKSSGGWPFQMTFDGLPFPQDFFNYSNQNLFWGKLSALIVESIGFRENHNFGFPLLSLVSTIIGTLLLFELKTPRKSFPHIIILKLSLISIPIIWLLMLRFGDFTLWKLVYNYVPGGSTIRVVYRFNAFLILPAIIASSYILELLWTHPQNRVAFRLATVLIASLFIAEQWLLPLDRGPHAFNRHTTSKRISQIPPPPEKIKVFFAIPYEGEAITFRLRSALDAWRIAQKYNLKTANGSSGVIPNGFRLRDLDYPRENLNAARVAAQWLNYYGHQGSIGQLDLKTKEWTVYHDLSEILVTYEFGNVITATNLPSPDQLSLNYFFSTGWSTPESWGTWSDQQISTINILLESKPTKNLTAFIDAVAYTPIQQKTQHFDILINGKHLHSFVRERGAENPIVKFQIPKSIVENSNYLEITIHSLDSCQPSKMEKSNDSRFLGLGLKSIFITETEYSEESITSYKYGQTITGTNSPISGDHQLESFLLQGWSLPESWGTWSDQTESKIVIPLSHEPKSDLKIELEAIAYTPEKHKIQHFDISINGIHTYSFSRERNAPNPPISFIVPVKTIRETKTLTLTIHSPGACQPSEMEASDDNRLLGLGLKSMRISEYTHP